MEGYAPTHMMAWSWLLCSLFSFLSLPRELWSLLSSWFYLNTEWFISWYIAYVHIWLFNSKIRMTLNTCATTVEILSFLERGLQWDPSPPPPSLHSSPTPPQDTMEREGRSRSKGEGAATPTDVPRLHHCSRRHDNISLHLTTHKYPASRHPPIGPAPTAPPRPETPSLLCTPRETADLMRWESHGIRGDSDTIVERCTL